MNYLDSLHWIHERTKFGIKPGVKRMKWMLSNLDHPEEKIHGVHVVGTNGKGSTVSYLRDALVANNYEVGTFTSPYIVTFNERISINGVPITNDDLVDLVQIVKPISERLEAETDLGPATEFEIITLMMFVYFGTIHPVDFVIVEAGLGALNDSTNVFQPIMTVLTSIGLDHTNILGDTYMDIAREKAGVIKPSVPLVYAIKPKDALHFVREVVESHHNKGLELDRDVHVLSDETEFTYRYESYELENIQLKMLGQHQHENAALAITTLIEMYQRGIIQLDFNKMIDAIENTKWSGRIEKVKDEPLVLVDGAHNKESIDALVDTLNQYYSDKKIDVLFAAIDGKPIGKMMNRLEEIANRFYVTTFDFPKALPIDTVYEHLEHKHIEKVEHYNDFIEEYDGELLVITGSLYFISEARKLFIK
ncbi:bifunctional folylpolyglutamate synthase/dihydrofolate synthase [Mammaliicoccus vitulinus]|uniref:bifunctional folylpolyglutamate synthase/dihydrofolate synthase n=1 Tax=Mammaliicoccus vitulinus TaxID=71237 RepID=UPI000D1D16D1|nr:folylpolyglutamate synthase/dihydrofolate synthase family protein [Mammaliicoccus vitulinus]PTI86784.1 bifunctional folylpolyglutamate synthase/dihydrofolate synthase [Mammaliicoccus vitulinus]QQT16457.1 bifunctional folylpolyglutamate synthase/dihydrofolate synthase [Mammaliicoccus vitulinus]QQY20547.1 bifunctional folylpolyglutamate synthase/dihydrofolate synthase [Mammaliicoccus vitulinus]RIN16415.1 bifunctional folylpolyglutamate synthase/dihydrofolate synthase [Mammaliicoccus vitulinus]